jgi:hypothetical protein
MRIGAGSGMPSGPNSVASSPQAPARWLTWVTFEEFCLTRSSRPKAARRNTPQPLAETTPAASAKAGKAAPDGSLGTWKPVSARFCASRMKWEHEIAQRPGVALKRGA